MSSEPFKKMAASIEHNGEASFGGAFVIVPPGGGDAKQTLILNPDADVAQFWGMLQAICQIALAEIARSEQAGGFGGRR